MNAAETLAALRAESRRRKYFVRLEILEQTASLDVERTQLDLPKMVEWFQAHSALMTGKE